MSSQRAQLSFSWCETHGSTALQAASLGARPLLHCRGSVPGRPRPPPAPRPPPVSSRQGGHRLQGQGQRLAASHAPARQRQGQECRRVNTRSKLAGLRSQEQRRSGGAAVYCRPAEGPLILKCSPSGCPVAGRLLCTQSHVCLPLKPLKPHSRRAKPLTKVLNKLPSCSEHLCGDLLVATVEGHDAAPQGSGMRCRLQAKRGI
jgi:hypothetical protein